jgi:hypothetical protein
MRNQALNCGVWSDRTPKKITEKSEVKWDALKSVNKGISGPDKKQRLNNC